MHTLFDYTFFKVLAGTTLIGISTGLLGCFTLLRKQSLLGDTIAHATLPGLTGMFLLILHKSYLLLLLGAMVSGLLGAYFVHVISFDLTNKSVMPIITFCFCPRIDLIRSCPLHVLTWPLW